MVRFGLQLPHKPVELALRAAVLADKLGFDSVFTPDHLVGIGIRNWEAYEAFSILAAASQHTSRVILGTCVSDVLRRNPAVLAQAAVTLDHLSGREVVLGLGAGEGMNLKPFGISTKFLASKLEEGVQIIRKLIDGKNVTFSGRFFRTDNAFVPKPRNGVKVWIAGNQMRTMLITAKYGDGWVPSASMGARKYRECLRFIRDKSEREIEPALFGYIVVDKSDDRARQLIELPAKFLSLLSPTRRVFLEKAGICEEDLGFPNLFEFTFSDTHVRKMIEIAKNIPFDLIEDRFIFGSPTRVVERLSEFVEAGVRHFVLTPLVRQNHYLDVVKLIATDVIPYFRSFN